MRSATNKASSKKPRRGQEQKMVKFKGRKDSAWDEDVDDFGTEKRMEKVVREQGRLTKKGGKMVSSGTSEYQIPSGDALEKMAYRP